MQKVLHIVTVFISLVLISTVSLAQQVEVMRFASLTGFQINEEFGTVVRKATITGDVLPKLFVGAPGATSAGRTQHGLIYLISLPIHTDSSVTSSQIIVSGSTAYERLGEFFELGDFNGDRILDIVVAQSQLNNRNGRLLIFLGPFIPGEPKLSANADIIISGINEEEFGSSISVVTIPGQIENGLLVGAVGNDDFVGKAYFFNSIKDQTELASTQAYCAFKGESTFELFAETVASVGDVNGDNQPDFLIGASKHTHTKSSQGAVYMFNGPFEQDKEYTLSDASTIFYGASVVGFWPGKLIPFGDLNEDGLDDFCISGSSDNKGRIALFNGRTIWPDSLTIGISNEAENEHRIIANNGSLTAGFGFSVDFEGDFNFNGERNLLIGAPNSNTFRGLAFVTNADGTGSLSVPDGVTSDDSKFGYQVVSLPNTNTIEVDPFKIDDFVVSAPFANATEKFNSRKSGVITFYSGKLNPPGTGISFFQNNRVAQVGDTLKVTIKGEKGSRPIVYHSLLLTIKERGRPIRVDSIQLPLDISSTTEVNYVMSRAGQVEFTQIIQDDLGVQRSASQIGYFGTPPMDIGLITRFFSTVEIKGSRNQTLTFESTASADTNGASLIYELLFATDEKAFETGTGVQLIQSGSSPRFTVTYLQLNTYLIGRGFVNLNVPNKIYWTIRVRNRIGNINLFSKLAINGPNELPFVRMGLDPIFDITGTLNRRLVLEGNSTDTFVFNWSTLQSENPNAVVDYKFVLLRDTSAFDIQNPVYEQFAPINEGNSLKVPFWDIYNTLVEQEVFWLARVDTVRWFYSVLAIIDGQEDQPWLPTKRFGRANIRFSIFFDIEVSNETEGILLQAPKEFEIYPNFPNPFNPTTQLKFGLPEPAEVKILVFNMLGQNVYSWNSGSLSAGYHEHGLNAQGWSSGIYLYQIQMGNKRLTGKMSLVK